MTRMPKRILILMLVLLSGSAFTLICISVNDLPRSKESSNPRQAESDTMVRRIRKTYSKDFFAWPIKGKIDLSGNFGELRTNHFHSGLDIRTGEGQIGIPVYAAGDGYISRINVSSRGYGKALYITHTNLYTTVYGHLSAFSKEIAEYTENRQYIHLLYEIELNPERDVFPVKKGDLIGYSGNTGGSGGPHLHFEIRDTEFEEAINPLLFGLKLEDIAKPTILSVTLYNLNDKTIRQVTGSYPYEILKRAGNSTIPSVMNVSPGFYAIGSSWVDYLRNGGFRMGIPYAKLFVNNELVFEQRIETMPFTHWRMVNCHLDHPILEDRGLKIIKLFRDNGNDLKIYPTSLPSHYALFKKPNDSTLHFPIYQKRGILDIKDSKRYSIKIVISDFPGHKDSVSFTINGNAKEFNNPERSLTVKENPKQISKVFYRNKANDIEVEEEEERVKVSVPGGILYETLLFRVGPSEKRINGHRVWDIMSSSIPINDSFNISFKPVNPYKQPEKYLIVRLTSDGKKRPEGGVWQNGSIHTKAKML